MSRKLGHVDEGFFSGSGATGLGREPLSSHRLWLACVASLARVRSSVSRVSGVDGAASYSHRLWRHCLSSHRPCVGRGRSIRRVAAPAVVASALVASLVRLTWLLYTARRRTGCDGIASRRIAHARLGSLRVGGACLVFVRGPVSSHRLWRHRLSSHRSWRPRLSSHRSCVQRSRSWVCVLAPVVAASPLVASLVLPT